MIHIEGRDRWHVYIHDSTDSLRIRFRETSRADEEF